MREPVRHDPTAPDMQARREAAIGLLILAAAIVIVLVALAGLGMYGGWW